MRKTGKNKEENKDLRTNRNNKSRKRDELRGRNSTGYEKEELWREEGVRKKQEYGEGLYDLTIRDKRRLANQ